MKRLLTTLRGYMAFHGIEPVDVAKKLNKPTQQIKDILAGKYTPRLDTFIAIAEAAGYILTLKQIDHVDKNTKS